MWAGRYSRERQSYTQVNDGLITGTDDFTTRSDQGAFTYSADAKYKFNPAALVYARIASGFVPGGPNDVLPGSPLPETFKSSRTTNYEVGVKGAAEDGRWTYDFDVFDIEWSDIQLIAAFNGLYGATNGGTARSRGVESGATYDLIHGLQLSAILAYTDARLTEDTPASVNGFAGDRLPESPFFSSTLGASYEYPLGSTVVGFGGADWHYTGDRLSEFVLGAPRQTLPGYSMIDLRAGVRVSSYEFDPVREECGRLPRDQRSTAGSYDNPGISAFSALGDHTPHDRAGPFQGNTSPTSDRADGMRLKLASFPVGLRPGDAVCRHGQPGATTTVRGFATRALPASRRNPGGRRPPLDSQ